MAGILIVDGYNILHSWGHLNQAIAKIGLDGARDRLIAELEDYAGTTHTQVIVVFDAYHTQRTGTTSPASCRRSAAPPSSLTTPTGSMGWGFD